ncbi:UDP-4-amino-4,6-dideoxy-N-acetyl-beta-L-altrosamine transaminase [Pontiellaceae bacterium B12227]|nr:UDP-4-amino-4,6-dideoxy-N-acetyl-beta-L-altrosamine transaminase [Pontiellaceae bacterium B12227]
MGSMIPYGRQSILQEDIDAVVEVLNGDWLTCGPTVERFEAALCDYTGAKHAIAVSNGTAALHVAMLAGGIKAGDRVVTSPNTFLASANCAEYVGATADFIDIDPETLNLSSDLLEKNWQADTRAVVAVDFAGRPCDMPAIAAIARNNGAVVIEDAAHALGSRLKHDGQTHTVGAHPWADMTTLSFHPVKTLTTGEGGAILTDSDELAEQCRLFRNHGMVRNRPEEPWYYGMETPGFNYRITDLQCALGISQLKRLDDFIARRQEITDAYNQAFQSLENLQTPALFSGGSSAWHLYVVQIDFPMLGKSRAQVMQELRELGVGTQVHYIPVHLQPYYRNKYGYAEGKCPVAEAYYEKCISLPLFPTMSDDDVGRVIQSVEEIMR